MSDEVTNIFASFFDKIKASTHSLLLTDYDGTLAPHQIDRLKALPPQEIFDKLRILNSCPRVDVIIISGRSLVELKKMLNINSKLVIYGSYGMERIQGNSKIERAVITHKQKLGLQQIENELAKIIDAKNLEIKPLSIALHWRGLHEGEQTQLKRMFQQVVEKVAVNADLAFLPFNGGLEIIPRGRAKSDAIHEIISQYNSDIPLAYLGDDYSDEAAFEAIGMRGLKILVSDTDRSTLADVIIKPGPSVVAFFDRWIKAAQCEP